MEFLLNVFITASTGLGFVFIICLMALVLKGNKWVVAKTGVIAAAMILIVSALFPSNTPKTSIEKKLYTPEVVQRGEIRVIKPMLQKQQEENKDNFKSLTEWWKQ